MEEETDHLLNSVFDKLPTSSKQWERVALAHFEKYPTNNRSGEACKKRYEKLVNIERPTGNNEIPRQVQRAKVIFEEIQREEVIGCAALNDSDGGAEADSDTDASSRAFRGTRLLDKNADFPRKPTTKKRKQAALAKAITKMATQ